MKKEKCNGCNRRFTLCGLSSHFQHQKDCKALHFSIAYSNNDVAIPNVSNRNDEASVLSPTKSLQACPINDIGDEIHNFDNESRISYIDAIDNDNELNINEETNDELEEEDIPQEQGDQIQMETNNNDHPAFSFHNDD